MFQFRLQSLVLLRESARDERRAQLADALRVDEALEQQQIEVKQDLTAMRDGQRIALGPVDVDKVLDAQRYELLLRAQLANLDQQRAQVAREIDVRRQALVEADREVKVLDKLRTTKYEQWRLEQERLDQRRLDEAATIGHYRQKVK